MKKLATQFLLLFLSISLTQESIYDEVKIVKGNYENAKTGPEKSDFKPRSYINQNNIKPKTFINKAEQQWKPHFKTRDEFHQVQKNGEKSMFSLDPVLNNFRRSHKEKKDSSDSSSELSSSSSREIENWKEEWKHIWLGKKIEALNATTPRGDIVNMVAARPWGVSCGDPMQHDMPWGTCMLPMECEGEYRIYRGDYFCGRTEFVCCALLLTNYDMYQGFEASFEDSGLVTDSEEKRKTQQNSGEKREHHQKREKKRRRRERKLRKRKMRRTIKKIIKEMRKILNKAYKNGTRQRKKKTKQLKIYIKDLKKQYKKDRSSVKDVHDFELIKIDSALQARLDGILELNEHFLGNSSFSELMYNGTHMNKKAARILRQRFPDLKPYISDYSRRSAGTAADQTVDSSDVSFNYDIEYGLLYY